MRGYSIALLISLAVLCKGQTTYEKGYLVNDKGDTIRGEVKLNQKKPVEIYTKLAFRDEKGIQKNYKPEKVKAYGFNNRNFVKMEYGGEDMYYEVITRGYISFYKLVFEAMYMKDVVMESEYFLNRAENKKIVSFKSSKFKKLLSDWMEDNPEFINAYAEEKEFNEAKATAVINQYNNWKASH